MARDEAMMFPNDRIRTWLANRVNKESSIPAPDVPELEESTNELDPVQSLEPELVR